MKYDPAAAFPAFVNGAVEPKPKKFKIYDPWQDSFMGVKPKPEPDVFNRVDYSDYDFKKFARDEHRKPRKIKVSRGSDANFGYLENIIGTTEDE